jgi:membrane protein YqaA with SNARE-associated domain
MCIVRYGGAAGRAEIGVLAQIVSPSLQPASVPHWLIYPGALGLFVVAVVESSVIPLTLPGSTDLLLLWLVASGGDPWTLAAIAIAGSLLGGYSTWEVGRKGSNAALSRYVPARMLGKITRWVKRHPVLAVFLPAVLPPPIPALPFVLASGALRVSRSRFLTIFALARTLRYSLIAWLGVHYGQAIVSVCTKDMERWSTPLLWTFGGLLVVGSFLGIWKVRSVHRARLARQATAARSRYAARKLTR